MRDSACWRSGEITQPRKNFFGQLYRITLKGFIPQKEHRQLKHSKETRSKYCVVRQAIHRMLNIPFVDAATKNNKIEKEEKRGGKFFSRWRGGVWPWVHSSVGSIPKYCESCAMINWKRILQHKKDRFLTKNQILRLKITDNNRFTIFVSKNRPTTSA